MDVALTTTVCQALLTSRQIRTNEGTTLNRLQNGKKVNSAVDDAVAYFKAKGLTDRAEKFIELKDSMDQNIQLVKAATNGLSAAGGIYKQMKGLVQSAKTADFRQLTSISTQWKDLVKQVNCISTDASYQGATLLSSDPSAYPAGSGLFSAPSERVSRLCHT